MRPRRRWPVFLALASLASAPLTSEGQERRAPALPGARVVHAESPAGEAGAEVARLREEAEVLRRRLAAGEAAARDLLGELARLDAEVALRRAEAREAALLAVAATESARRADDAARSAEERARALRRAAGHVAAALYRAGPAAVTASPWRALLVPGASPSRSAASVLLVSLERQRRLLGDLRASAAAASAAAGAARDARDEAAERRRVADGRLGRADTARAGRARRLRDVREDAAEMTRLLGQIQAAERELTAFLSGGARVEPPRVPLEVAPRPPAPARGVGPAAGRLPWPLADGRGRLAESFGEVTGSRRGTRTVRHGIVLEAPEGTPIRAIAAGRVVFADWYKGFGRCVVVDHGRGDLSVVGHAGRLRVEPGALVAAGEMLAEVGDTGSLWGPRLYLQLQRAGEPVDPLPWLARP